MLTKVKDRARDEGVPRMELKMRVSYMRVSVGIIGGLCWGVGYTAEYPVAGITPDRRPENAPVISEVEHDGAWFRNALTGIDRPYPFSLKFLDDQGAWYTPFNRPGMTGPYDIRGWHGRKETRK
jgi:hypothetical protein